jgi:hypothetical protein
LIEWIKFNGEGVPPTQIAGLLYDGFELPPRESLGDSDKAQWPIGLSGMPEDPWKRGTYIVLQNVATHEYFTFVTRSKNPVSKPLKPSRCLRAARRQLEIAPLSSRWRLALRNEKGGFAE